jgi:uncharacterized membrane protein
VTGPYEFDIPAVYEGWVRSSSARDINNQGIAVGDAELEFPQQPLIYVQGAAHRLSRPPGSLELRVHGLNEAGQVLGSASFPRASGIFWRTLVWLQPMSPEVQPLQLPEEAAGGLGTQINDSGVVQMIVGTVWRIGANGSISQLSPVAWPWAGARALALNNAGAVAGDGQPGDALSRMPFFRPAGREVLQLEVLTGHTGGVAWRLNSPAAGEPTLAAGISVDSALMWTGTLWTVHADGRADPPVALGPAAGYSQSNARSINARGWVVGTSFNRVQVQDRMATVWLPREDGGYRTIPLPALGPGPAASFVHLCRRESCSFADTSMPGSIALSGRSWQSGTEVATADEVSFAFRQPGSYTVTLHVTDLSGRTDQARVEIQCTRRLNGSLRCR